MSVVTYAGRRPKRFKWLRRYRHCAVLYALIGFFVVPAVIKSQMLKRLPGLTKRAAAIQQVKFNPYALSLTIRGFSLKETNGEVFSSFDEFYANFQPIRSLFKWSPVFKRHLARENPSARSPFARTAHSTSPICSAPMPPATPPPPSTPGAASARDHLLTI